MPKEKDGSLSFVVFLRLIQWSENSDLDEKLKVIFNYINNGRDIDLATLTRMYKKVYPTISDVSNYFKGLFKMIHTILEIKYLNIVFQLE